MKKIIVAVFIVGFSILLLYLFTDFFTKIKVKKPVGNYLSEHYGIKDGDFKILSAYYNLLAGVDIETYIEIKKPYHTTTYVGVDPNSYEIDEEDGKNVFSDIFKGAYIQQNSEVLKLSEKIIEKYNLLSESPDAYQISRKNFYYYLEFTIDEQQQKELLIEFKQKQKLNTKKMIKNLNISESKINTDYEGVVNFHFDYELEKDKGNIPDIQSIMNDYEKSNVLTEGIYSIELQPRNPTEVLDGDSSIIVFSVDKSGEFQVIKKLIR